jgi:hypothetical protein
MRKPKEPKKSSKHFLCAKLPLKCTTNAKLTMKMCTHATSLQILPFFTKFSPLGQILPLVGKQTSRLQQQFPLGKCMP